MARQSVTIRAAKIGGLIAFTGLLLTTVITCIVNYYLSSQATANKQSIGDFKHNTIFTGGKNSPVILTCQNIQNVYPTVIFTNLMQSQSVVTNIVYRESNKSVINAEMITQIQAFEKARGVRVTIPSNRLACITTPPLAFELIARLKAAYYAGDISKACAIAREGTNLYCSMVGPYEKDLIKVEGAFLEIAAQFYCVLSERAMYKKDYPQALLLIQHAQEVTYETNALFIAMHAALFQLNGDDEKMGYLLAHAQNHYAEDIRYEIINTLTRMGYLLPYKARQIKKGKWVIESYLSLAQDFKLSKELDFPLIFQVAAGPTASNPTIMRWVGLNQYEPIDLASHFLRVIEKIKQDEFREKR